jgi:hypothetical protein
MIEGVANLNASATARRVGATAAAPPPQAVGSAHE